MTESYAIRPALASLACLASVVLALPGAADQPHSAIQCGDIVSGTAQLEEDLTCDTNPALTVRGHLDLNGFSVTCLNDDNGGVLLDGHGAILRDGSVEGCFRAVVLAGRGEHLVTRVTASGTDRGFSVESGANRLVGNRASASDDDAFRVEGPENLFSTNTVTSAAGDGFDVRTRRNVFANNEVMDVGEEGFDVRERFNEILSNVVSNAAINGIQLRTGDNLVANNLITDGVRGILVGGFNSEPGGNNYIVGNNVVHHEREGIVVDVDFVRQRIFNNAALNNNPDLRDLNSGCDDNLWFANTFETADPADCIR